jgi:phospholipid transport system transporter-binding protein
MPKADAAPALRTLQPGHFEVAGVLTTPYIARLRAAGLAALRADAAGKAGAPSTELTMDLDKITRVDSAGLALLIDWLASAQQTGRRLRYSGGPPTLRALARVSNVENLIYAT